MKRFEDYIDKVEKEGVDSKPDRLVSPSFLHATGRMLNDFAEKIEQLEEDVEHLQQYKHAVATLKKENSNLKRDIAQARQEYTARQMSKLNNS